MSRFHLVRVGQMGNVGRFHSPDARRYPRGCRVIVRTQRGLEIGEVLAAAQETALRFTDGPLLRGMTTEDELLAARLDRHRDEAYQACVERIEQLGLPVVLMDVEHLFDGQSLYFYYLGEVTPAVEAVTHELAEVYDARVQSRRFTETVTAGCGPACGTEAAGGCGSCAGGCQLASACGVAAK